MAPMPSFSRWGIHSFTTATPSFSKGAPQNPMG